MGKWDRPYDDLSVASVGERHGIRVYSGAKGWDWLTVENGNLVSSGTATTQDLAEKAACESLAAYFEGLAKEARGLA